MKSLEIISVRIPGGLNEHIMEDLRAMCREIKESLSADADVYANGDFPGDLAIILSREEEVPGGGKTGLGSTLSVALKRFGLVDHAVWIRKG